MRIKYHIVIDLLRKRQGIYGVSFKPILSAEHALFLKKADHKNQRIGPRATREKTPLIWLNGV